LVFLDFDELEPHCVYRAAFSFLGIRLRCISKFKANKPKADPKK
jgi:hypothetical protein